MIIETDKELWIKLNPSKSGHLDHGFIQQLIQLFIWVYIQS